MMQIIPIGDRLLVRVVASADKSKGGIFIPHQIKDKPHQAVVVSVGEGRLNEKTGVLTPHQVKPGDHVYFTKYQGNPVKVDGIDLLVLRMENLELVIEHDESHELIFA